MRIAPSNIIHYGNHTIKHYKQLSIYE